MAASALAEGWLNLQIEGIVVLFVFPPNCASYHVCQLNTQAEV